MGLRKRLMGEPSDEEIQRMLKEGATILDIRPQDEFDGGHIAGSLHIPIDELLHSLPLIPKDRPVITCNADDALSATAAEMLGAHGFKAYDGGGWTKLVKLAQEP
ncbi:MAG: rhodanese-like domain-containing protein [Flavobacteriales bacterium]|nr:rhodanese-like domain-containing protein [Flavobacteriales bacterium]